MLDTLLNLDSQLLLFFNGHHSGVLDNFMMLFTGKFIWIPMYAVIIPILFKKYQASVAVLFILGLIAAIALADQTCATLLRPYFQRLRPSNLDNPLSQFVTVVNGYRGGSYGLPSCHAANSFALATFLKLAVKRPVFTAFILIWASINCYSRMYLGVHYPGDILAGAVVDVAYGVFAYYAVVFAVRRFLSPKSRQLSDLHLFSAEIPGFRGTVSFTATDIMIAVGIISALSMLFAAVICR